MSPALISFTKIPIEPILLPSEFSICLGQKFASKFIRRKKSSLLSYNSFNLCLALSLFCWKLSRRKFLNTVDFEIAPFGLVGACPFLNLLGYFSDIKLQYF